MMWKYLSHLFQNNTFFTLSVSLTAHWVTCLAHTRWPLCNHVTSAAHTYGEWKRPSCAAVSIHHPFPWPMQIDKDSEVLDAVLSVAACKMVCHKKCMSKITVKCTAQCARKVSSITVSHTIYSQGTFCHHLHNFTNIVIV